jgi:catechol 2,3-dioxygenase-like lactoylglutathione lyase family enzyme
VITGLDHVALAVRDLDAAVDGYTRLLGVEPNWIGGDGGARHAWFQFPNMALDVISPHGEGAFGDRMRAHLDRHGEGIWATANPTPDDTGGLQVLLIAPPRDGQPWPLSEPTGPAPVAKLDHVVVYAADVNRALALYGAKLGLDLRLDRENPQWNARQLFFRAGDAVIEVGAKIGEPASDKPDRFGGLAWRVDDPDAAQARIAAAGFDVSEVRTGRKPGTKVFTVRDAPAGVPTLMLSAEPVLETA